MAARKKSRPEHDFIPVVDLFAGPGGLGEGFSSVLREDGLPAFKIVLSVEMDPHAHKTLELRSFRRQFTSRGDDVPDEYYEHLRHAGDPTVHPMGDREVLFDLFPGESTEARNEALNATMGVPGDDAAIARRLRSLKRRYSGRPWVVIGGPPCQAYSLVGRARNKGIADYDETKDDRHQLYRQYLEILQIVKPDVFVMENVKGILSSRYQSERIFDRIRNDLERPAGPKSRLTYDLVTVSGSESSNLFDTVNDTDFIVRAENHGIPQARHRVFVIGRSNPGSEWNPLETSAMTTVRDAIGQLPKLRSGLSKEEDSAEKWADAVRACFTKRLIRTIRSEQGAQLGDLIEETIDELVAPREGRGSSFVRKTGRTIKGPLSEWLHDPRLKGVCNHETRSHIRADLGRYLFCAAWSSVHGVSGERTSPKLHDMPKTLLPKHANAGKAAASGSLFNDRFRAQSWNAPSTTITAHISKDGHYFIHPDPAQVRSLTVREAARLQTFPDDYLFCGPRTEQYRQVGNAVPPLVALQIAKRIHFSLNG